MEPVALERERGLLGEIGWLADRVRDLRRTNARGNKAQIKDLTGDLHAMWEEVRALRAPPVTGDAHPVAPSRPNCGR